jgi:hypothetical protein
VRVSCSKYRRPVQQDGFPTNMTAIFSNMTGSGVT